MLTIEKIRKLDPSLSSLTETELMEARDILYDIGQLAFEVWKEEKTGSKDPRGSLLEMTKRSKIKP